MGRVSQSDLFFKIDILPVEMGWGGEEGGDVGGLSGKLGCG